MRSSDEVLRFIQNQQETHDTVTASEDKELLQFLTMC